MPSGVFSSRPDGFSKLLEANERFNAAREEEEERELLASQGFTSRLGLQAPPSPLLPACMVVDHHRYW